MTFKILNTIGEEFAPEGKRVLESIAEVEYRVPSQQDLLNAIQDVDAILVGLGLTINREVINAAGNLKAIATATTGLDHIDVAYAEERGIAVVSLRNETEFLNSITGTSELAFGMLISLFRRIPQAFDAVQRYEWDRDAFKGYNLYGKTLGIVGLGRLGCWMARYGKAFGMRVLFFDPNVSQMEAGDFTKTNLDKLLTESDAISIHVHLLPETEGMIGEEAIGQMKQGAYLVNTSRGKIVNEAALLQALKSGHLGGYATDVLADELSFPERGFAKHPLVEYAKVYENVLIVPHIGGMTHDSRIATDVFMAEKLKRFLV
jgi:D-3-phosphoglycerate dehydrogenase